MRTPCGSGLTPIPAPVMKGGLFMPFTAPCPSPTAAKDKDIATTQSETDSRAGLGY
jgi:hypothetical protein